MQRQAPREIGQLLEDPRRQRREVVAVQLELRQPGQPVEQPRRQARQAVVRHSAVVVQVQTRQRRQRVEHPGRDVAQPVVAQREIRDPVSPAKSPALRPVKRLPFRPEDATPCRLSVPVSSGRCTTGSTSEQSVTVLWFALTSSTSLPRS